MRAFLYYFNFRFCSWFIIAIDTEVFGLLIWIETQCRQRCLDLLNSIAVHQWAFHFENARRQIKNREVIFSLDVLPPSAFNLAKRSGSNQSWLPENWRESDIAVAGVKIAELPEFANAENGVTIFGEYKGVRVGVIKTNAEIGTIFPDATKQP